MKDSTKNKRVPIAEYPFVFFEKAFSKFFSFSFIPHTLFDKEDISFFSLF